MREKGVRHIAKRDADGKKKSGIERGFGPNGMPPHTRRHPRACPEDLNTSRKSMRWQILGTSPRMTAATFRAVQAHDVEFYDFSQAWEISVMER